jgi:hypothetical protein
VKAVVILELEVPCLSVISGLDEYVEEFCDDTGSSFLCCIASELSALKEEDEEK